MTHLNANVSTRCCFNKPAMSLGKCEQQIRFLLISLLLIAISRVSSWSLSKQSQVEVGKIELFIHVLVSAALIQQPVLCVWIRKESIMNQSWPVCLIHLFNYIKKRLAHCIHKMQTQIEWKGAEKKIFYFLPLFYEKLILFTFKFYL